jgi:hypothetical protein
MRAEHAQWSARARESREGGRRMKGWNGKQRGRKRGLTAPNQTRQAKARGAAARAAAAVAVPEEGVEEGQAPAPASPKS